MPHDHLGPWDPLPIAEAAQLFEPASFQWWIAGGYALEAHLESRGHTSVWREHDDADIGITRSDAPQLFALLDGWDLHLASDGVLTPWDGRPLDADDGVTNLWCREAPQGHWKLDVLIGSGNHREWIYRPDTSVRRSWGEVVLRTPGGLPYLAPEIQLLFKSRTIRPKDDLDARHVIPLLTRDRQAWLSKHLPVQHPWQALAQP